MSDAGKSPARKKASLSKWATYSSISWQKAAKHDHDLYSSRTFREQRGRLRTWWFQTQVWIMPAAIGILTATAGSFVEIACDLYSSLRFGYCPSAPWRTEELCAEGTYRRYDEHGVHSGFAAYVLISGLLVTIPALLVAFVAPTARGSGIPEVKTILGGFVMPDVLEFKTLVTKIAGLSFSVGAGLSCGKEGPLVHIASCISHNLCKLVPRWKDNEAKRRELLSTAAAAGVAVAFGAPLGGVLFSLEEVSTMFPTRTMIFAFFAASVAAVTLASQDPTGTGKLTLFTTHFNEPPSFGEYPIFFFMGAMGGILGAIFIHFNLKITRARRKGGAIRKRCPEVLEVILIAIVTALMSYFCPYTQGLSSKTIHALFHHCGDPEKVEMFTLCDGDQTRYDTELVGMLCLAMLLRYVQMTFTFGTGVPCGLFVPCLYTGACLGRIIGCGVKYLNEFDGFQEFKVVNPGVYAMIGAAAVLGGTCRVTISLVVIMFELTDGLQLVVAFMIVCLISKWTGDYFNEGIYDSLIKLRNYPYLHESDEGSFGTTAKDVMDDELEFIVSAPGTIRSLREFVQNSRYSGFPVVRSQADRTLLGFVYACDICQYLERHRHELTDDNQPVVFKKYLEDFCVVPPRNALDLSPLVAEDTVRVSENTQILLLHDLFRKLGVKIVLVERFGELIGMITKKGFVHHLHLKEEHEDEEDDHTDPHDQSPTGDSQTESFRAALRNADEKSPKLLGNLEQGLDVPLLHK